LPYEIHITLRRTSDKPTVPAGKIFFSPTFHKPVRDNVHDNTLHALNAQGIVSSLKSPLAKERHREAKAAVKEFGLHSKYPVFY